MPSERPSGLSRALRVLQESNMRMLQANSLNEGRGNSNARMAEILDEESGYSELYEALEGLLKSGAHDGPCDNTDEDGARD